MDLQGRFGARVRTLRTRMGLTQKQLAQRCGGRFVTQRIGEIERGNMNCTLQTIAGLCRGLKCEPLDLFLFDPENLDRAPVLRNRRLADLWSAAGAQRQAKLLRVLSELLAEE